MPAIHLASRTLLMGTSGPTCALQQASIGSIVRPRLSKYSKITHKRWNINPSRICRCSVTWSCLVCPQNLGSNLVACPLAAWCGLRHQYYEYFRSASGSSAICCLAPDSLRSAPARAVKFYINSVLLRKHVSQRLVAGSKPSSELQV
jgi:hypothetical protein